MPSSTVRSLCIVRLSALGDVTMLLPLLRCLRRHREDLKIVCVIGRDVYPVLSGLKITGIEFVVVKKPRSIRDYFQFRQQMRDRQFDALFCLQASWRANWLYPFIRAQRKIGYGPDRAKDGHRWFVNESIPAAKPHLVDGFLQFAEHLGFPAAPEDSLAEWGLGLAPDVVSWAGQTLPAKPWMAVNPCSSKGERDWTAVRYAAVMRAARDRFNLEPVLLGGPAPRELAMRKAILAELGGPCLDLTGRTSISQLMAALARCRCLLAPDTGSVHIARAFNRPVVGLYAVAPAHRTGPYRATDFCVDKFDAAARRFLGIDPTTAAWSLRVHHREAMALIEVEEVVAKLAALLATTAP